MSQEQATFRDVNRDGSGFSLVEVTVAMGIFAFVVVGILGLLPAAMKLRAESSADTRGVIIAQELFAGVKASSSISNVLVRVGANDMRTNDILTTPIVLGYPAGTTVPFFYYQSPEEQWANEGGAEPEVKRSIEENDIQTMARLRATNIAGFPNLYVVTVEVRSPAALALSNSKPAVFQTYFSSQ